MAVKQQTNLEKLNLNVSGHRFEVLRSTLEKYPDTLLGSNERDKFFDEEKREYFFDRDPDIFRHILNYYRTGKLHYPKHEFLESFEEELKFFGVLPDVIGDCCYEDLSPPTNIRQRMWRAFENPQTSTAALIGYYATGLILALSVAIIVVETVPCGSRPGRAGTLSCGERYKIVFFCLDTACVMIFTAEYLLRLFAAPSRLSFALSFMSVIDILTIVPFYFSFYLINVPDLYRAFRILKIARYSIGLRVFGYTIKSHYNEFLSLIGFIILNMMTMAVVTFYAEKNVEHTSFTSIPETFWFTFVTMTTLGYGDFVPVSTLGRVVSASSSLICIISFALFVYNFIIKFNRIYQRVLYSKENKEKYSGRDGIHSNKAQETDNSINA